ncbi:MAG: universal stress protein [Acidimicrobiales bacterium]
MQRIVVGVDGSTNATDALAWATAVAEGVGAGVVAVTAFDKPSIEVPPEDRHQLRAEREAELDRWIAAVDGTAEVRRVVSDGDPRQVILGEALATAADLVVLGHAGASGGPGFLHLGSVVEYAAHHTAVPLAVIPAGWRSPPERVVIGVDGSAESLAAIAWASSMAPLQPAVTAVQVAEPLLEWTPASSPDNWRRGVERDLAQWTTPLTEAGLSTTVVAKRRLHPADGLLAVAEERAADLLVVGTRGLGGFRGLRAGGVALKILHRTGLPLVLVPVP